ncbi:hypothetical protein N3K66_005309 [Trichothecium roseum]|uniref:Uncharacterized protein n=1 Tax=Trichothecium roseum TaxID=47278 RepID=A0ACC0UYU6_9HYPO|nr:hypothetical protein N3K66_005309 [Trichothecium roseum]
MNGPTSRSQRVFSCEPWMGSPPLPLPFHMQVRQLVPSHGLPLQSACVTSTTYAGGARAYISGRADGTVHHAMHPARHCKTLHVDTHTRCRTAQEYAFYPGPCGGEECEFDNHQTREKGFPKFDYHDDDDADDDAVMEDEEDCACLGPCSCADGNGCGSGKDMNIRMRRTVTEYRDW